MSDTQHTAPSTRDSGVAEPELVSEWRTVGHEVDAPIAKSLFRLTTVMLVITIIAGIGVSQLFKVNSSTMMEANAKTTDAALAAYRLEMQQATTDYARDDKTPSLYQIPVDRAIELIAKNPSRLRAATPPPDFVHPDDEKKK